MSKLHADNRERLARLSALPLLWIGIVGLPLWAQHSTVPVILVNGFQFPCVPSQSSSTFGKLQAYLNAGPPGASVSFFDNCNYPGATIEQLGANFGAFVRGLPSTGPFDVIAHSMGGLIVRAYLAGLQNNFLSPPVDPKIRKLILIATPNFGTDYVFPMTQVTEMQYGSAVIWTLSKWNQGYDDLRGLDAIAIAGNAGTVGSIPSDGVVTVPSASLGFAFGQGVSRTRVIPYCHTGIVSALCGLSPAIADIESAAHPTYQIIRDFLDDNPGWALFGLAPNQVTTYGGLQFMVRDAADSGYYQLTGPALAFGNTTAPLTDNAVWYTAGVPSAPNYLLNFGIAAQKYSVTVPLSSGSFRAVSFKFSPDIQLVIPSAGLPPGSLSVAADSLVSIYGAGLAASTIQATTSPAPFALSDASITIGGQPARLLYAGSSQINAQVPANLQPGLYQLTLTNSQGKHSITLMIAQTAPSLFTLANSSAAAEHAVTGQVVTVTNAASVGEFISLFATGLGPTVLSGSLNIAVTVPAVSIGGHAAVVSYAGRAPGYQGLDQINVQIPAGVQTGTSIPVIVTSGSRSSNTALIAVK